MERQVPPRVRRFTLMARNSSSSRPYNSQFFSFPTKIARRDGGGWARGFDLSQSPYKAEGHAPNGEEIGLNFLGP
jgi:hypothetical protein